MKILGLVCKHFLSTFLINIFYLSKFIVLIRIFYVINSFPLRSLFVSVNIYLKMEIIMKYILLALMALFLTAQIAMAQGGGPSFEQLNKANNQGKPLVELIGNTSKKGHQEICLISVAKGKVKEKPC